MVQAIVESSPKPAGLAAGGLFAAVASAASSSSQGKLCVCVWDFMQLWTFFFFFFKTKPLALWLRLPSPLPPKALPVVFFLFFFLQFLVYYRFPQTLFLNFSQHLIWVFLSKKKISCFVLHFSNPCPTSSFFSFFLSYFHELFFFSDFFHLSSFFLFSIFSQTHQENYFLLIRMFFPILRKEKKMCTFHNPHAV